MLEVFMSVWPDAAATLEGNEGELMLVSIAVEARRLEGLLETLALLDFPVNPEIYHDAPVIYAHPDAHEEAGTATLVEFPAYHARLDQVRGALAAAGFDTDSLDAVSMLAEIHSHAGLSRVPRRRKYAFHSNDKYRTAGRAL
jgi:hypothetical protein